MPLRRKYVRSCASNSGHGFGAFQFQNHRILCHDVESQFTNQSLTIFQRQSDLAWKVETGVISLYAERGLAN
jgi:hypothetical protein